MLPRSLIASLCLGLPALVLTTGSVPARDVQPIVRLLDDSSTVLGQPLAYPTDGTARIQSLIVTMQPGEQTGPHKHPHPTYGYILDGVLTVDYANGETRIYKKGDALLEAVDMIHNGRNTGAEPVRILVVFMGVDGMKNSLMEKQEQ